MRGLRNLGLRGSVFGVLAFGVSAVLAVAAGCWPGSGMVAGFWLGAGSAWATGGVSVSPSALTIEVGSSKTFTVTAANAIGDVTIVSSNAGVARVSTNEWGTGVVDEGQTKVGEITVTGVSEGNATITLMIDAATFDGEDLAGQTRTVAVNVVPAAVADPGAGSDGGGSTGVVGGSSGSSVSSGSQVANGGSVSGGFAGSGPTDGAASGGSAGGALSSSEGAGSSAAEDADSDGVVAQTGGAARNSSGSSGSGNAAKSSAESGDSKKGGLSFGMILAGVGAAAVVTALIGGAVWFVKKNR